MNASSHLKQTKEETTAERRDRLIAEIAAQRVMLRLNAQAVVQPLRRAEALGARARDLRHWAYPAAPLLLVSAWRFRSRLGVVPQLALRGLALWRMVRRFQN